MQQVEGPKPGEEETFQARAIIDIKVNKKKVITDYLIEGMGWRSKAQTILLINEGRVDAVVVKEKGSVYIRTRPDELIPNNLEERKPR